MVYCANDASGVLTSAVHFPSSPTVAVYVFPSHDVLTVTYEFLSAHPQSFASVCCCTIMLSLKISGMSKASADSVPSESRNAESSLFIVFLRKVSKLVVVS